MTIISIVIIYYTINEQNKKKSDNSFYRDLS